MRYEAGIPHVDLFPYVDRVGRIFCDNLQVGPVSARSDQTGGKGNGQFALAGNTLFKEKALVAIMQSSTQLHLARLAIEVGRQDSVLTDEAGLIGRRSQDLETHVLLAVLCLLSKQFAFGGFDKILLLGVNLLNLFSRLP